MGDKEETLHELQRGMFRIIIFVKIAIDNDI